MSEGFTAGPWELLPCSHGGAILKRGADARTHPQSHLQIVPIEDARLIVAAPELYAMLDVFVSCLERGDDQTAEMFVEEARQLLARINGKDTTNV
jgi:hypothetical protein